MKFALVSHILPPSRSGQAMVLYRLLKDLDPSVYCLISSQDYATETQEGGYSGKLPGTYYRQAGLQSVRRRRFQSSDPPPETMGRSPSILGRTLGKLALLEPGPVDLRSRLAGWRELLNAALTPLAVQVRSRQIVAIVRHEACSAVLGCSGDLPNLPAAYLASRQTGIPFYAYLFDYYSHAPIHPFTQVFARQVEAAVLKRATGTIVPNQFLQAELRQRYGVEATVIHNPVDIAEYQGGAGKTRSFSGDSVRIVYTGTIYSAHYDAFQNLLTAIESLEQPDIEIHLYTAQSARELEERGLQGAIVIHGHQPLSEIPNIQQSADLLFLPLAFKSPYPEIVRTSAPGKMGEYLASGRPILVHAPPDSFMAWYFREHQCGLVVDQNDPAQLTMGIERILKDPDLRAAIGHRAQVRAVSDFGVEAAQSRFASLMGLQIPKEQHLLTKQADSPLGGTVSGAGP